MRADAHIQVVIATRVSTSATDACWKKAAPGRNHLHEPKAISVFFSFMTAASRKPVTTQGRFSIRTMELVSLDTGPNTVLLQFWLSTARNATPNPLVLRRRMKASSILAANLISRKSLFYSPFDIFLKIVLATFDTYPQSAGLTAISSDAYSTASNAENGQKKGKCEKNCKL